MSRTIKDIRRVHEERMRAEEEEYFTPENLHKYSYHNDGVDDTDCEYTAKYVSMLPNESHTMYGSPLDFGGSPGIFKYNGGQ